MMSALWAMFIGIGLSLVRGGDFGGTPATPNDLLQENGDRLMQEDGTSSLLLEQ